MSDEKDCYLEARLNKLEWEVKEQQDDIHQLISTAHSLTESLHEIKTCLQQIKHTAFGMLGMFLLAQLGLENVIKLL